MRDKAKLKDTAPEQYASALADMLAADSDVELRELRPLGSKTRSEIIQELEGLGYEIPEDALTTELAMILQEEEDGREAYLQELREAQAWEERFFQPSQEGEEEEEVKETSGEDSIEVFLFSSLSVLV